MNLRKKLIVSSSQQENAFDSIEVTVFKINKAPNEFIRYNAFSRSYSIILKRN